MDIPPGAPVRDPSRRSIPIGSALTPLLILDPLHSLLRLTCKHVDLRSALPSKPVELEQVDGLVIAARRGGDPSDIQQELERIERLLELVGLPALYLGGLGAEKLARVPRGITVERLPTTIQHVGAFLETCKGLKMAA